MNDEQKALALMALDTIATGAQGGPAAAIVSALATIGRRVLLSDHEDPVVKLIQIADDLRDDVEAAFLKKFPRG